MSAAKKAHGDDEEAGGAGLGTLDDKYALIRELGEGATGRVFEAEHLVVGKKVAVKILHHRLAGEAHLHSRFVGEARAAAQINHENVIDIFDFGVTANGSPYLVMELLEGETLQQIIARRGAMPPAFACDILVQVLAGLGAAHRLGIVHRDLKPANIVVTYPRPDSPLVKVLDFGIAEGVLTPSGEAEDGLLGTPLYMAPEQALGQSVDARADLYAAGVLLYEMLAGEPPFSGSVTEILSNVVSGKWRPLQRVNPAVPRALTQAVASALATLADDRVQTAEQLGQYLIPYLSRPPPRSIPHGPNSADAFLLKSSEMPLLFDAPASRPPRDFPSLHLARVAGKPRGEPLADSILQSPIIPRAPVAPKIQLFTGGRELENWSTAPGPRRGTAWTNPVEEPSPKDASKGSGWRSRPASGTKTWLGKGWRRALVATAFGLGLGAFLAWLYQFGQGLRHAACAPLPTTIPSRERKTSFSS